MSSLDKPFIVFTHSHPLFKPCPCTSRPLLLLWKSSSPRPSLPLVTMWLWLTISVIRRNAIDAETNFLGELLCSHAFCCPLHASSRSPSPELSPKLQVHIAKCLQPLRRLPPDVTLALPKNSRAHPSPSPPPVLPAQRGLSLPAHGFNDPLCATDVMPLVLTCPLECVPFCPHFRMVGPGVKSKASRWNP